MLELAIEKQLPGFTLEAHFTAGPGITALFGRSGAGKTTLINLLAGLLRPDAGRIRIGDRVLFDSAAGIDIKPEHRRLGYVFQEDRLFPHLSVRSNLTYGERLVARAERRIHFDQVVELLGIGDLLERRPNNLSGGEKQRVAIGRALLASPELVLMDEPLANLDAGRRSEILPFIERLRDRLGLRVVYVSHSMDEIVRLADTVVLMSEGKTVATGSVEAVMGRLDLRPLTGRYDAGAVLAATMAAQDETFGLSLLDTAGGQLHVPMVDLPLGAPLRVRIRARDVSLALQEPVAISVLNRFPAVVREIGDDEGAQVDVLLDIGCPLWARITRRSAVELKLAPGSQVWALIKAVAIDRQSLGQRGAGSRL